MAKKKKRELEVVIEKMGKKTAKTPAHKTGKKLAMARVVQTSYEPDKRLSVEDLKKAGLKPNRRIDDWFPN